MNKSTIFAAFILALFLLSCGDSSVNIDEDSMEKPSSDSNSGASPGSSNPGGTSKQTANAVIITLTYWESKETDGFGSKDLDPRIYFKVIAKNGNATLSSNNTSDLLYADDIGQSWSGSKKSSAISFNTSATELQIHAVVIERDVLANDDISPGYYMYLKPPFYIESGSYTLDYGTGKSKVRFNYEFVWQ